MNEGLTFGDVLIVPAYSDIESRDEIDITTDFLGLRIKPIISSPMDTVSSSAVVDTLDFKGYYGIYPRTAVLDNKWNSFVSRIRFGIAVGAKNPEEILNKLFCGPPPHSICIDVAHGDHKLVVSMIGFLRRYYHNSTKIIAGNVVTAEGYRRLADAGADAVRVGIGSGSACTTRETTGIGYPQLSAIMNVVEEREKQDGPQIIADGGIESGGDIVKALAAGADVVMLGKMLAGHAESPGNIVEIDGKRYKPYKGQSMFGSNGQRNAPEGIAGFVPYRGSLIDTLNQLEGWIKSGLSYVGARDLTSLRRNATFVKVSPATQQESNTRILELP